MEIQRELDRALESDVVRKAGLGVFGLDCLRMRDGDVLDGELLDEHFALASLEREDVERWQWLRDHVTADHLRDLRNAGARHPVAIDLVAHACETSKQLASATRSMFPRGVPDEFAPVLEYALRRFVHEPAVAKRLLKLALRHASKLDGNDIAWLTLYVGDTRETAQAVAAMLESTRDYTNHGLNERRLYNSAKRARQLAHRKLCRQSLQQAFKPSWVREEVVHSTLAVVGGKVLGPLLEQRWADCTEYSLDNYQARALAGAMLLVAPKSRKHHDAARDIASSLMRSKVVGFDEVGGVNGIVMGIEGAKIRALRPLLAEIAKWKFKPSEYDNHGPLRAALASELVRRRAKRALTALT
jgi:hypothetical protein